MIRYAEDHPNTWSTSWSSTFTFDLVRPYPKRIAILTMTIPVVWRSSS
ncbi:MAG: hypothetical protein IPH63_10210 [Flavobacteriales bacterium]|nr:hypothetical protein [Flavobacteriales bacterium]